MSTNGKQIWAQRIGKVGNPDQKPPYPGARSTPTVDGDVLYALGSDGDLVCMEPQRARSAGRKHLRTDFGGKPGEWAYAESPLVDGDVLVVHARRRRGDARRAQQEHRRGDLEVPVPEGGDRKPATRRSSSSTRAA